MKPYPLGNIFAYLKADSRRAYLSYLWSALAMGAALVVTYLAQAPRQQAPFLFVASTEVMIAVVFGFGPAGFSAIIAVVGMRTLFHEPFYSLAAFFAVSVLVGIVSEKRIRTDEILRRQALLFANITDAIIVTSLNRKIVDLNPAAEAMFGYSKAELVGVSVDAIQKAEEAAARGEEVDRALADRGFWKDEIVFLRKDASQGVSETTVVGIRDARGKLIAKAGINRDITKRKELEQKLLQAQKMEAVGRLAGGVAHDFNNLLTAILGYCELLLNQVDQRSPAKEMLVEIEKAGRRAASLTSQLLAFSRRQILQPEALDLNQVISESEKTLRGLIGEDVRLNIVFGSELRKVRADRAQIEQVLTNLAANARDAMPKGGSLHIETANVREGPHSLEPDLEGRQPPVGMVRLVVEDTGKGMDQETVSHIFEPFFTTKPLGTGSGLGLSTVYGIIKQSGGEIRATSTLGRGSRFEILLPAEEPMAAIASTELQWSASKQGKTILVVEDESAVRQLVKEILSDAGYAVIEAPGGKEALALSKDFKGRIDLVISDVVMPSMRGPQVVEELSLMRPKLPVIFMSGYTAEGIIPSETIDSDVRFISKPFTPDELLETVRATLSHAGPDPSK